MGSIICEANGKRSFKDGAFNAKCRKERSRAWWLGKSWDRMYYTRRIPDPDQWQRACAAGKHGWPGYRQELSEHALHIWEVKPETREEMGRIMEKLG